MGDHAEAKAEEQRAATRQNLPDASALAYRCFRPELFSGGMMASCEAACEGAKGEHIRVTT